MFVLMPIARNGVQTTLGELAEHFGIPFYGVYRPLGGSECDFVNLEPSLYLEGFFSGADRRSTIFSSMECTKEPPSERSRGENE